MACAPSEVSDQPGHPPSLISLRCPHEESLDQNFPLSAQQRLHDQDWVDAQDDQSLRWAHMLFPWFCHEVAQIMERCPGTATIIAYLHFPIIDTSRVLGIATTTTSQCLSGTTKFRYALMIPTGLAKLEQTAPYQDTSSASS